jgi:hypothetical protein
MHSDAGFPEVILPRHLAPWSPLMGQRPRQAHVPRGCTTGAPAWRTALGVPATTLLYLIMHVRTPQAGLHSADAYRLTVLLRSVLKLGATLNR